MRRVIIQEFRTARRTPARKVLSSNPFHSCVPFQTGSGRSFFSGSKKNVPPYTLSASMQFPKYSIAALLVAVGGGVWYYRGEQPSNGGRTVKSTTTTATSQNQISQPTGLSSTSHTRPLPDSASIVELDQAEADLKRSLIVGSDEFYSDILENVPITKSAEDLSSQVLEMLTPEQATAKLRRNEKSYLVGRGRGVVRYDVVQVPSNNPIEDDHAEKIVEVPQTVTPPQDGSSSSDWMFWGLFDGHRYVLKVTIAIQLISAVVGQLRQSFDKY